jgi:Flp pilus assembly protein CpaB
MNPNNNHDPQLISKIDRRVEDGQNANLPLIDDLAGMIPQARADFQQTLEDRLLAHMQQPQNGDEKLTVFNTTLDNHAPKNRFYIPLTLAAAIIAVVIVSSILLMPNGSGSKPGSAVSLQETVTLTLSPTGVGTVLPNTAPGEPVPTLMPLPETTRFFTAPSVVPTSQFEALDLRETVIAAQPISQGTRITADMLTTAFFAKDAVPNRVYYNLSLVEGRFAIENIPQWQPVTLDAISDTRPLATPKPISPTVEVITSTPQPTAAAMMNIAVFYQTLPRGYQFPNNIDELEKIVGFVPWPVTSVPLNAIAETGDGLNYLLGRVLRTDVYREQPVIVNLLVDDATQLANVGSSVALNIPKDRVAVSLPIIPVELAVSGIQEGDHVDVITTIIFSNVDEGFQNVQPPGTVLELSGSDTALELSPDSIEACSLDRPCGVTQTVVFDAVLVHLGDFLETPDSKNDIATLAVLPDEATVITWMLEANLPFALRPAVVNATQLPAYPDQIPSQMWLTEIDLDKISGDISVIQAGDTIDVSFSFLSPEVVQELPNTTMPENGRVTTQTVLYGAKLYKLGDSVGQHPGQFMTLLMQQGHSALLSSLMQTTVPYAITITRSNSPDIPTETLPDGRVKIEVPISSVAQREGFNQASTIVNILARLTVTDGDSEQDNPLVSQIILHDAEILDYKDPTVYILAIAPAELNGIQWALKAGLPLAVELRGK